MFVATCACVVQVRSSLITYSNFFFFFFLSARKSFAGADIVPCLFATYILFFFFCKFHYLPFSLCDLVTIVSTPIASLCCRSMVGFISRRLRWRCLEHISSVRGVFNVVADGFVSRSGLGVCSECGLAVSLCVLLSPLSEFEVGGGMFDFRERWGGFSLDGGGPGFRLVDWFHEVVVRCVGGVFALEIRTMVGGELCAVSRDEIECVGVSD